MPTGYTAAVQDGTITEFSDFAMQCARAFGALVTMRDDAPDAAIPEEFKPAEYYAKSVAECRARLAAIESMTLAEAELLLEEHNRKQGEERRRLLAESQTTQERYAVMLEKAERWQPPTPEHSNLKAFMVEQLRESIKFDCRDEGFAERCYPHFDGTPKEWRASQLEGAQNGLQRALESEAQEVERVRSRNAWVKSLRESLKSAT